VGRSLVCVARSESNLAAFVKFTIYMSIYSLAVTWVAFYMVSKEPRNVASLVVIRLGTTEIFRGQVSNFVAFPSRRPWWVFEASCQNTISNLLVFPGGVSEQQPTSPLLEITNDTKRCVSGL